MTNYEIFKTICDKLGFPKVAPYDFYRAIFAEGELQREGVQENGRYNAMAKVGKKFVYLHDELTTLPTYQTVTHATMNCIAYAGESGKEELAREIHAFVVKVNFPRTITWGDFAFFIRRHIRKRKYMPTQRIAPTFVTTAGEGHDVLFYYVLKEPIPMYTKFLDSLKTIQTYLSREVHTGLQLECGVNELDKPRPAGLYTRYPVVGTRAGEDVVEAYRIGDVYTLKDLNALLPKAKRLQYNGKTTPLAQAKKLWPEWHEKCIVQKKDMSVKHNEKKPNKALFDWYCSYTEEHATEARPGVFEALAAFAVKAAMPETELQKGIEKLRILFADKFSREEMDEHIAIGLEKYAKAPKELLYWKGEHIEALTGFSFPKTKRNGRTQKQHLARVHKKLSDEKRVRRWREANPDGTKADCAHALEIAWATAHKWWEPKSAKKAKADAPSVPVWRKCKEAGCTGTLQELQAIEFYGKNQGNFYRKKRYVCDCCGNVTESKARVVN